ncbi:hypothetical protein PPRY_a2236 [Pseudoalteromonas prydzensis ACAM 620]|nr:hypothetical protein [Pseudoalteromonas prydzensis ACAM 620]
MNANVPDCLVEGYEPLINGLSLPDQDDRHVVAAAIKGQAELNQFDKWYQNIGS